MKQLMILASCFLMIGSSGAWAATSSEPQGLDPAHERAMKRQYPGGVDEEDLKVQDKLVQPRKKYNEKTIEKEVVKSLFEDNKND